MSLKEKQEEQLLTTLPPPTPSQIQAIGVAVENVVQEFGLNNEDLEQRLKIKTAMEDLLHPKLPGITLPFGLMVKYTKKKKHFSPQE